MPHNKKAGHMDVSVADVSLACIVLFGDVGCKDETYANKAKRIIEACPTDWQRLMRVCAEVNKQNAIAGFPLSYDELVPQVKAKEQA